MDLTLDVHASYLHVAKFIAVNRNVVCMKHNWVNLKLLVGDLENVYVAQSKRQKLVMDKVGPKTTHSDLQICWGIKTDTECILLTTVTNASNPIYPISLTYPFVQHLSNCKQRLLLSYLVWWCLITAMGHCGVVSLSPSPSLTGILTSFVSFFW